MGQRLIISIETKGEPIAKLYYHWSAYTESALYETQQVINCIYNHKNESIKELQLRLIRFCEKNGGGIRGDDYEMKYIQNMFPNETFKTEDYSRNRGLIALSEKGMDELQSWSEGDVIIDLDEDEVNFEVYAGYESFEEYVEYRRECDDEFEGITLEKIPDIGFDLESFDALEVGTIIAALDEARSDVVRNGNEIFELVC